MVETSNPGGVPGSGSALTSSPNPKLSIFSAPERLTPSEIESLKRSLPVMLEQARSAIARRNAARQASGARVGESA